MLHHGYSQLINVRSSVWQELWVYLCRTVHRSWICVVILSSYNLIMYLNMKQKQKRVIDCNSAAGTSTNDKSLPMLSLSTTAASVRSVLFAASLWLEILNGGSNEIRPSEQYIYYIAFNTVYVCEHLFVLFTHHESRSCCSYWPGNKLRWCGSCQQWNQLYLLQML